MHNVEELAFAQLLRKIADEIEKQPGCWELKTQGFSGVQLSCKGTSVVLTEREGYPSALSGEASGLFDDLVEVVHLEARKGARDAAAKDLEKSLDARTRLSGTVEKKPGGA
jgi:hypothetical protein